TDRELRYVQAALVISRDYHGLLDAEWGSGSQGALEDYTDRRFGTRRPRFRHLRPLLAAFEREWRDAGWEEIHFDDINLSIALPAGILE
ncbi:hypothetical protein R0J87_21040, partial [Halomonas sp. SIMBA_159]